MYALVQESVLRAVTPRSPGMPWYRRVSALGSAHVRLQDGPTDDGAEVARGSDEYTAVDEVGSTDMPTTSGQYSHGLID